MIFQGMGRIVFAGDPVAVIGNVNSAGAGFIDDRGRSHVIENPLSAQQNRDGRCLFVRPDSTPRAYRGA